MKRRIVLIVVGCVVLAALVVGGVWVRHATSAERLLERAGVAMEARKYDKAADLAQQYVDKTHDWRGYLLLGQAYNKLGDHAVARVALVRAETLSTNAEIRLALMDSYTTPARTLLSRRGGDRLGAIQEALSLLDRARAAAEDAPDEARSAVALRSANGLNYVALAKAERSRSDALSTQAATDQAAGLTVQSDAKLTQAQQARARVQDHYRRATDVLLTVVAEDPAHAQAANALAETVIELDDASLLKRTGDLLAAVAPDRRPPLAWGLIVLRNLPMELYPVTEPFRSQCLQQLDDLNNLLGLPRKTAMAASDQATIRRKMGQAYVRLDVPDKAMAMFDLALQADARDPLSQLARGQALLGQNNVEAARKQLYDLVSQYGDWSEAQYWYAQAAMRRGEMTLALQSLRRATRADRTHAASRRMLIDVLLAQTPPQAQQAYEDARELLELTPGDAGAIERYIRVARLLGRAELADAQLVKIRQECADDPRALWAVAQGIETLHPDRRDQARAVAAEAIAAPAARFEDHLARARALQYLGRDAQAETLLRDLLDKQPLYAPLHFELGMHHDRAGRSFQAAEFYARAAELDSKNKVYGRALARVMMRMGDVESGTELLDSLRPDSADAGPSDGDTTLALLDAQRELLQQTDPLTVVERLQRALPREQAQWLVALEQLRRGKFDDCLSLCRQALASSPEDTEMLTLAARALSGKGQHAEAADMFRRLVAHQPDSFAAHLALAREVVAGMSPDQRASRDGKPLLTGLRYPGGREDLQTLAAASTLESAGNYEAASVLYAAVASRPAAPSASREQARLRQALCWFALDRHEECLTLLRSLQEGGSLQSDAALAYAHILTRLSRASEAQGEIKTLWSTALLREDYRQATELAALMLAAGAGESALSDTTDKAADQPQDVRPLRLQTYVLRLLGREEEALPVYETILALQPGEFTAYLQFADAQDRCRNPAGALEALDRLASQGRSGQNQALLARSGFLARWGLTARALDSYRECETFYKSSPPMLLAIARQYHQLEALSDARRALAMIPAQSPVARQAQWLVAVVQDSPEDRLTQLEKLGQAQPPTPAMLEVLLRQELSMGLAQQAVERTRRAAFPASALVGTAVPALTLHAMTQLDDWSAACEWADTMVATGAPWWRQVAATLWTAQDQPDKAHVLLRPPASAPLTDAALGLIAAPPDLRPAYAERALVTADAAAALSDSQRVSLRVLIHLAAGNIDQAAKELPQLRGAGPALYDPAAELVAAANGADAEKASREARALLLATVASNLQQPELAQRLAADVFKVRPACQWALSLAMRGGDEKLLADLQELYPDKTGLLGLRLAAMTAMASLDYPTAVASLEQALAQTPDDVELKIQLAEALQKSGREDRALVLFREAMETSKSSWSANNAAYLTAKLHADDPARLAEARTWIERAIERHPTERVLYDTAGWLAFLRGDADLACRELHQAVQALPQSPDVHYHLGMAHRLAGRTTFAQWHLQQAIELGQAMTSTGLPVSPETRQSIQLAQDALVKQ